MSEPPAISVIVPFQNAEEHLNQCLDSIYWQTFPEIEVICVDNGSSDGSRGIAQGFASKDHRFRIIDKYKGDAASAKNAGLDAATGRYILFLRSDDWIAHRFCERTFTVAEDLHAELLFFNILPFNGDGMCPDVLFDFPRLNDCFEPLQQPSFLVPQSVCNRLFRSDLVANVRFIDGSILEDRAFFVELNILAKRAAVLDEPIYYWRKDNSLASHELVHVSDETFFHSVDAVKQVLDRYDLYGTLYDSVFAADDVERYVERILALPYEHCHKVFSLARQRTRQLAWPKVMETLRQRKREFRLANVVDRHVLTALRRGGFWRYSLHLMASDWRNGKHLLFVLPLIGRLLEWCYAFTRIRSI